MRQTTNNGPVYFRLIALWVLCEAMLGGFIHALKIPVSGLVVGSSAVICICLIAFYVPTKGSIIKATIIVAIFKMMMSPQAPVLAYGAVFFQGIAGELIFLNRRFYKAGCFILATLALIESGFQKILVLTIISGTDFWVAVNDVLNQLTPQTSFTDYSFYIACIYLAAHLIAGFIVGWWASIIPERVTQWNTQYSDLLHIKKKNEDIDLPEQPKKKTKFRYGLLILWIVLLLIYLQSYYKIGNPILPPKLALYILIRSLIIIFTWYFLLGPLLAWLLKKWLQKKQLQSREDIREVLQVLPAVKKIATESWQASAVSSGLKRILLFSKLVLVRALYPPPKRKTNYILTGATQSGKTTSLMRWSERRNDVFGILTPVIHGKRFFMDAHTKEKFPMEAEDGESETLTVGRFVFSKKSFEKAIQILRSSMNKEGWLIIDEIGPLELQQQGFFEVIRQVMKHHPHNMIWVIREGFADKAAEFFNLQSYQHLHKTEVEKL